MRICRFGCLSSTMLSPICDTVDTMRFLNLKSQYAYQSLLFHTKDADDSSTIS